ncbi:hypothetical protein ES319_A11G316000v1 [Gossypium barbadense]|uniref:HORMA domain-containing protein n=1 Tax=Gossypium barbadense TaxID=3634 RepID=A0A5J5TV44_GOSBA|nr:hypothetical protein ES319_A11G316000v1 [Gossypium barbadense]
MPNSKPTTPFSGKMERKGNQGEIAGILVEFLEVAITSVVYLKGIYPSGAFERRRYMNVVVQRARHPQLREYIHSAVSGLLPSIQKGLVERVAVTFFNTDNIPMERFIFKLTVNQSFGSKVEESDLEFSLRSFLIKLSVSQPLTTVLPRGGRSWLTSGRSLRLVRARMRKCGSQLTQNNGNNLR